MIASDPVVRLERWRMLARAVSVEQCRHLGRSGFPMLARELLRLRGDAESEQ